jgi:DNA modification methylase
VTEPRLGDQAQNSTDPDTEGSAPGRRATSTSNFGVSRRENHDASDFYARFTPPNLSTDDTVNPFGPVDWIHHGDARAMDEGSERIKANSVALVVTSPPYFAGKAYEEELGSGHIPSDYIDYLQMLRDVFATCVEKLEPGGRIAVNVANLGRKPYRSLAADIIGILQDDLGLLLRGEIIWRKAEGSSGSCAWGSFQSASNPVIRDLTERVIVASKGRFDRAIDRKKRARLGLPSENTIFKDDFMDWTTDVWNIGTESAVRVGHPAPYPVELPQRLIELYTYRGDVILDPFMGSGTSAVAAIRTHRHYVGFDTDSNYVKAARERAQAVLDERESGTGDEARLRPWRLVSPAGASDRAEPTEPAELALREGWMAKEFAVRLLADAGFDIVNFDGGKPPKPVHLKHGVDVAFSALDQRGHRWYFDLAGSLGRGNDRAGLRPADVLWKALGKATVLQTAAPEPATFVLLTTDLPPRSSPTAGALKGARGAGRPVFDVLELLAPTTPKTLARYARQGPGRAPVGDLYPPTPKR